MTYKDALLKLKLDLEEDKAELLKSFGSVVVSDANSEMLSNNVMIAKAARMLTQMAVIEQVNDRIDSLVEEVKMYEAE